MPTSLLDQTVDWYHQVLGHPGMNRMYQTISSRFYIPGLKQKCEEYYCESCQKNKLYGPGFGKLPPRHAPLVPWDEVMVDLVGPWRITIKENGVDREVELNALTSIDPVTNLVELIRIENKTSQHVAQQFANSWLARYPRPNKCIHDRGGEFIGQEFQALLQQVGVADASTTSRNPTANAICERLHQTVANVLRATLLHNPPQNMIQAEAILDNALATAMHVTRVAVNKTLGNSPGGIVYQRDMLLDIPLVTDMVLVQQRRQMLIDDNLMRQNRKRREYHFAVGQEVLIKEINPGKLDPRAHGPYPIVQVHTNGTIDVLRNPHVTERINIRRVIPYRR